MFALIALFLHGELLAAAVGAARALRSMELHWNRPLPCWLVVEQDWDLT